MRFLFQRRTKSSYPPTDRLNFGRFSVPVWIRKDDSGEKQLYWSLDKIAENGQGTKGYRRLLSKDDLLAMPEVLRHLAEVLADIGFLPLDFRKAAARLSLALAQVNELMRERYENGEDMNEGRSHGLTAS